MAVEAPYKKLKVAYEDIARLTVRDGEEVEEVIDAKTQQAIVRQVNEEYDLAYSFNEAKRTIQLARLQLYNNQRRDAEAVGDPLMFTVFNTVLAALYDDRLMARWEGRGGEGDEDIEENLNALAEYDYDVMGKSELDYFWDWDACFFGRGLVLQMGFNREDGVMAPIPEIIDPMAFIRDPRATSVNGDAGGKGAMRFGGWESGATYWELKRHPGYFNVAALKKGKDIQSLLQKGREARRSAQGQENFSQKEESLGKYNNYEFSLLNWFTTIKGEKYLVTVGNARSVLVRLIKLNYNGRWPLTDRTFYPIPEDWDGVSIPDLTEDKQRMRAVLLNLGLISAKADALPRYLYDKTRIKNKNDLNYRSNKYIGVDGRVDNALLPVQKNSVMGYIGAVMDILDQGAQRANATPEIQMGVGSDRQRTLGELNLVSSKVDTRYSMSAKIFGWSEKRFWQQWYTQYKLHFKDKIDEKIIRIAGSSAPSWRPLTRENIIMEKDPDVKIESRVISEAKRQRDQQAFDSFVGLAMQEPTVSKRYLLKKAGKLRGLKKEELDMVFPPTVDELQAEEENKMLNEDKLPKIGVQDDHQVHIYVHGKANQTPATLAHIRAHKKLMILKRNRPDLFQPQALPSSGQGQPSAGAEGPQPPQLPPPTTPTQ